MINPRDDPYVCQFIDEWVEQQDKCAKNVYPSVCIDKWRRVGLAPALAEADSLPQVKLFRWRVDAAAINASLKDSIWHLEYYDPVARARQMESPPMLGKIARGYSSIKVKVEDGKASVA